MIISLSLEEKIVNVINRSEVIACLTVYPLDKPFPMGISMAWIHPGVEHSLSQRNHLMDVDIPYQTGFGGRGTLNWPFYV